MKIFFAVLFFVYLIGIIEGQEFNYWNPKEFDFIVVGVGTGGSVVASRLSENPHVTVLALEAGDKPPKDSAIPLFASKLWSDSLLETEIQNESCLAMIDKQWPWIRGEMLGGTSSINAMMHTRGNKNDYDHWEEMGNEGWGYDGVLPYFLKMEDYRIPHNIHDAKYHSKNGPITISKPLFRTPLADAFLDAGMELGYHEVDYNAEIQKGFMNPPFNIRNGSRCGTYEGYIEPATPRSNLQIVVNAKVTKILIENNQAKGVQFTKDGTIWTVKARKEVIITAGTPLSPQILMLSGIGPKTTLEKYEIPVVLDLPGVGQNVQDHVAIYGVSFTLEEPVSIKWERDVNEETRRQFEERRIGLLTLPLSAEGVAFVDTSESDLTKDDPDLELLMVSNKTVHYRVSQEIFESAISPPDETRDSFYIYPAILRPLSKGYITLRSRSPFDPPIIHPNYLTVYKDVKILREGLKMAVKLVETTSFQRLGAKYHNRTMPGCENIKRQTDEYWECVVRHYSFGFFHMVGSCKMGPKTDPMAVVDSQLRVHGIKGLRVADASIMPNIISAHTHAPTVMIAEKVADMIKNEWKNHDEL